MSETATWQNSSSSHANENHVVFDFETTGLDPRVDRIVQVGVLVGRGPKIEMVDSWIVNQRMDIPEKAASIHGITTERMMQDGMDPAESLDRLSEWLGVSPHVMGHNIHRFDCLFLAAECTRIGRDVACFDDWIDTAAIFKGWRLGLWRRHGQSHSQFARDVLSRPVKGLRYNVQECCRVLGIDVTGERLHDAGGDVVATHHIYAALLDRGLVCPPESTPNGEMVGQVEAAESHGNAFISVAPPPDDNNATTI